jgi:hypothetical protein
MNRKDHLISPTKDLTLLKASLGKSMQSMASKIMMLEVSLIKKLSQANGF